MARVPFVSLDGLDGTGKSTQCRLLAEWLRQRGLAVTECADPGGTKVGDQLRELLLHSRETQMAPACEALLFMASRAQLVAEVIRPALEAGRAVVCDRFLLANVVYQGHAGGLDVGLLWEAGRLSTGGLTPDLTLVFDLTPDKARARRRGPADRVEGRDKKYHARVRAGFLAEARRCPERVRVIDAGPPAAEVQEAIRREVARLL
jgi:dTMP kinase